MKHPNKNGRGKHFTKGKYGNYLKELNGKYSIVNTKIRRTSRARVKIYKYDGKPYKIKYRKIISLTA